jgi:glutaminyl-peptide cyclotransferase
MSDLGRTPISQPVRCARKDRGCKIESVELGDRLGNPGIIRNLEPGIIGEDLMTHVFGWVLVAALVATGIAIPVWWISQTPQATSGPEPVPSRIPDGSADEKSPPKLTEFATGSDAKDGVTEVKFDDARALKYLKQLCDLGPRMSGTETMKKQQDLIEKHCKDLGATVTRQEFKGKQLSRKEATEMVNLIISWHPDKMRRVLISSHYDTRPIADQERLRTNWNKPFVSANDGTSGVAFLMELGHHMKDLKSEFGVDFVLFDGEEYVFETSQNGGGDKYFFGSEYFADEYLKTKDKRKFRYDAGFLLDLCAGKDAQLKVEDYSFAAARTLVDQVWGLAKELGAKSFKYEHGYEIQDDHLALIKAGIPTVDIIDFDYPHWHKLSDTPDKVSGAQMAELSKVLTTWLQKVK